MTSRPASILASLAATLMLATTVAHAQGLTVQGTFTLVSPSLPMANDFACTVVNISSQPVTLKQLQLVHGGLAIANPLSTNCEGTLQAGERCTRITVVYPLREQVVPHCRAVFMAAQSAAVVGSLSGYYTVGGSRQTVAALELQPLVGGVTLHLPVGLY